MPDGLTLTCGQHVAITDDEADTLGAEILSDARDGQVDVLLNRDNVLAYAD